jgi:hypothetical protein
MGFNDHLPDEDFFVGIAVEAGALTRCPVHWDVTIRVGDPAAERRAYAIATVRWKADGMHDDRVMLMDGIKDALDMASDDGCPACGGID